jgi:hypothetical protein
VTPFDLLIGLIAGGMLGMIGQGVRAVAGLKKMLDAGTMADFRPSILLVSLLIGFIAGALAFLASGSTETAVAFVAAGYAGTDFIEAFMRDRK